MGIYKVNLATGASPDDVSWHTISIVLLGVQGESAKHQIPRSWISFTAGAATHFEINVEKELGELLLVRLSTECYKALNMDAWYCLFVNVTCPSGQLYQFPLYKWISGFMTVDIPEGRGFVLSDSIHPLLQQQRKAELEINRTTHKWRKYAEGVPHCIDVDTEDKLTLNDRFSPMKQGKFDSMLKSLHFEMLEKGYFTRTESWNSLEDIELLLSSRKLENSALGLVKELWKEDSFFGYQYLNGVNPIVVKKCFKIPENFPVTDQIVAPIIGAASSLQEEILKGNIFLADYKILQGVPANRSVNGKQQYIAAPMCLLWKNPQDHLLPIAIQLSQVPGKNAPIFLPSDPEYDWLLAKIWIRNSEFQIHEINAHLLRTHLMAEVFNIATTRQLPMSHPMYKLIIPHLRFTLEINIFARNTLINRGGFFDRAAVIGKGGIPVLLKKAMNELTFSSLCLPDDIKSRGMESIPNYLYRDDGMKIWAAVESFVSSIVHYYYSSDSTVSEDPELQAWVAEIFKEGFLENKSSGIPSSVETKASLIKYLTMVIFTCSAQHAAVNSGQFVFYSWLPNGPPSMKSPPPSTKGVTTMQTILEALPEVNTTVLTLIIVKVISEEPSDQRRLGQYPDVHFTEETPQKFIKAFQDKLAEISEYIQNRNKTTHLPYCYLDPVMIDNSVSI